MPGTGGRSARALGGLAQLILDGLDRLAELVDLLATCVCAAVRDAPEEHRASDDDRVEATFHVGPEPLRSRVPIYLDE